LNVITTEAIALSDQQTAITILQRRMVAAVDLVKAVGGGWDASTLPSGDAIRSVALAQTSNTVNVAQPNAR
jgi:outer membrane protein TolC